MSRPDNLDALPFADTADQDPAALPFPAVCRHGVTETTDVRCRLCRIALQAVLHAPWRDAECADRHGHR